MNLGFFIAATPEGPSFRSVVCTDTGKPIGGAFGETLPAMLTLTVEFLNLLRR